MAMVQAGRALGITLVQAPRSFRDSSRGSCPLTLVRPWG